MSVTATTGTQSGKIHLLLGVAFFYIIIKVLCFQINLIKSENTCQQKKKAAIQIYLKSSEFQNPRL